MKLTYSAKLTGIDRTPFDWLWMSIVTNELRSKEGLGIPLRSLIPFLEINECNGFSIFHRIILQQCPGDLETELRTPQVSALNAKDMWGRTALVWAAIIGDARATFLLLRAGADPNIRDGSDLSPFKGAFRSKQLSCALLLLPNGVDVIKEDPADCGSNTLNWLSSIPGYDLQAVVPVSLVDANGVDSGVRKSIITEVLDRGANIHGRCSFRNMK